MFPENGGQDPHNFFYRLVRQMRVHQNDYFRNKTPGSLGMAKKYEAMVDRAIRNHLATQDAIQLSLFKQESEY